MASKSHGMLFDAESVRGILGGYKTRTFRAITATNSTCGSMSHTQLKLYMAAHGDWDKAWVDRSGVEYIHLPCHVHEYPSCPVCYDHGWTDTTHRVFPRIEPGHSIWGRETFVLESTRGYLDDVAEPTDRPFERVESYLLIPHYRATGPDPHIVPEDLEDFMDDRTRWSPGIHLPRKFSRISLDVTSVVAQRARELTLEEIIAEGAPDQGFDTRDYSAMLHNWWRQRIDGVNKKHKPWENNTWGWGYGFKPAKEGRDA